MSQAIRTMFERIAPTYDVLNRTLSLGVDKLWRRQAVATLGDLSGKRVLDLCAGTMDLTAVACARYPTARVVAADFAREMLLGGLASGKLSSPTVSVLPIQADALSLPFLGGTFDAALCAFGVRNLDNPEGGLLELHRVLAPGGKLVVLEFFRPTGTVRKLLHNIYNRHVVPAIGGIVSGSPGAYRYLAESMEGFLSRAEFEQSGRRCGFVVDEARDLFPHAASLVVLRKDAAPC
ncbi:MAG: ubiquinone/menaquinone biosynthesis methyltransferase [Deltaproteobacteria bacterium]|nr:ubiquinone/menaquinone biosynthesis methyltransferase [Deltaproteobacteria bacterium]